MNNETKPQAVDVLDTGAVLSMRALADQFEQNGQPGCAREQNRLAAAVAELRLTAAAMLAAASACAARREPFKADSLAIVNLRAALARMGAA